MKILWISPTPSHPQDAGNRAHIHAMGREILAAGHDVTFLLYGQEQVTDDGKAQMRAFWPHFVFVPHRLNDRKKSKGDVWGIDDWFNTDLELAISILHADHEFDVVICEYVFFSKALAVLPAKVFKILSCHDRMSDRAALLQRQGIPPDFFYTTSDQEKIALDRADLVLSIQADEQAFFSSLTKTDVIEVGYPVEANPLPVRSYGPKLRVGYLGSGNSLNRKSLEDFLKALQADAGLKAKVEVVVAGSICKTLSDYSVICLGVVGEEADLYREVDLVINPMVDGTGLKIKTLSAIRHGMPFISTETGTRGIPVALEEHLCSSIENMVTALSYIVAHPEAALERLRAESARLFETYQTRHQQQLQGFLRAITTKNTRHVRRKRVLIVTDVPFWEPGWGSHSRISSLCHTLMDRTELAVFFYGSVWAQREKQIAAAGFGGVVVSYKEYEDASKSRTTRPTCPDYPGLKRWRHEVFLKALEVYLGAKSKFDVIIFQYLWLAYTRDALWYQALTVLDTHDLMAYREYRFSAEGLPVGVSISLGEELSLLDRFNVVVAIQSEEVLTLSRRLRNAIPICCPHAIELPKQTTSETNTKTLRLGFVGGNSDANHAAISWFIDNVWPIVSSQTVVLNVYGSVCERVKDVPENVRLHGLIDDLSVAYGACDIMINPMIHGGGIKIKSVEALAYGKPLIASPEGAVGIHNPNASGVIVAESRIDFVTAILRLLRDPQRRVEMAVAARHAAAEQFNPDTCFGPLLQLIEEI